MTHRRVLQGRGDLRCADQVHHIYTLSRVHDECNKNARTRRSWHIFNSTHCDNYLCVWKYSGKTRETKLSWPTCTNGVCVKDDRYFWNENNRHALTMNASMRIKMLSEESRPNDINYLHPAVRADTLTLIHQSVLHAIKEFLFSHNHR